MSVLKSVIITLPKGLAKAPGVIPTNETLRAVPKFNFAGSLLSEESTMESKKINKQEHMQDESAIFKTEVCVRGKKRRLDHLTWEEKLQRKKLKNRVAAQTSRDRKKAKLDELEETVRTLRERNDMLTQECAMLRSQNESLATETKRLTKEKNAKESGEQICSMCQARVGCAVSSIGSAVSSVHPPQQGGTVQPASSLTLTPGAAILLKILTIFLLSKNCSANSKGMITSSDSRSLQRAFCEKLPQKWREILVKQMNNYKHGRRPVLLRITARIRHARNVTLADSNGLNISMVPVKEDTSKKCNYSKGVVGQTSKNVETGRTSRSVSTYQPWHSVPSTALTPCNPSTPSIKTEVEVKQESDVHDLDTVYGTYDEATNSITIIYPGEENGVAIQECVQEVSTDDVCQLEDSSRLTPNQYSSSQFSPAYTCTDTMSPSSIHSEDTDGGFTATKIDSNVSDCGYESHGSPNPDAHNPKANVALTDLWHESFSELFPTLA